jgi:hypothetical protein
LATQPGTCSNPLPLIAGPLFGLHIVVGDTTDGLNETVPTCDLASTAPERVL